MLARWQKPPEKSPISSKTVSRSFCHSQRVESLGTHMIAIWKDASDESKVCVEDPLAFWLGQSKHLYL